ncbi:response regulator [Nitrospiraceae bacterium AH_259_D15_M11_P09]|nr:response regulator [Nitrospiraceae bacterium AH_259_D15_M11_P09]
MSMICDGGVSGRQGRVLVVDDEASVRKPICLSLNKAGFEVVEAENGEQAIKKLNEGDNPLVLDAILCDIRMPKFNGTEAITYFRHQYPSIPVVVLTGYPDVELGTSLMKQGVMDYLIKPVTKDNLLAVVGKAVDQHVILDN